MKVALLHPTDWPEVRRGSERVARELGAALLARGHEVTLLTSHPGRATTTVEDGLRVVRTRRPPWAPKLADRRWEPHLWHVPAVRRALRADPPDVAHALYPTDVLAVPPGIPCVLSVMGIVDRRWVVARHLRAPVVETALRRARAVTVLSEAAAGPLERDLGVRAKVVPPPVDLDAFRPGPGRAAVPTVLCAADHTEPRKHVADLVAAWPAVRAQRPGARLVLSRVGGASGVGGGEVEGVEVRDLDDRTVLAAAAREAWAAALLSEGEAFGLVAAEALACGTPCVVRADGALPEVVDRAALGWWVGATRTTPRDAPPRHATPLDALLAATAAPPPADTAAACRTRAEAFSAEACAAAFEALYREVL